MISSDNPLATYFFRSETSIREERKRQLACSWKYVIHPHSKFRAWYELYICIIYLLALTSKPIDMGFAQKFNTLYPGHRIITTCVDFLCLVDIFVHFFTGFVIKKNRTIELRLRKIAIHYMKSPYFISDLLSSFPRNLPYYIVEEPKQELLGTVNILGLLKIVRIFSVVKLIYHITEYFKLKVKGILFLACSLLVFGMTVHWMACLQFGVPRIFRRYFANVIKRDSWIYMGTLYEESFVKRYTHSFFQASAFMLGINIRIYKYVLPEEFLLGVFTYVLGKIMITTIWIILAVTILESRSMQIKFHEIINQLDEYMKLRQIPINLRDMISQYYTFKYQNKFFKEEMITDIISDDLRNEVNMHVCRSLISNVSIFADLSQDQMNEVVAKLVPQIFLPKDTIIQSGSVGDAMYFLSSGTVAVYTHSGREVCHLQDGAYFGEVSLVMKNHPRSATIIAIEISQVYKLSKRHFERHLTKNKKVLRKIAQLAELRFKEITQAEERYKNQLLQKSLQK